MPGAGNLTMSENVDIKVAAKMVSFGKTVLNMMLAQVENDTKGGPLDIHGVCEIVSHPRSQSYIALLPMVN